MADTSLHSSFPSSIVMRSSLSSFSLSFVISIMSFLLCLALCFVLWTATLTHSWRTDIDSHITLQLRPDSGSDMSSRILTAQSILSEFSGVRSVRVLSESDSASLLEPWLGANFDFSQIPIPRLLSISINTESPPDLPALVARLSTEVGSVSLDNHYVWSDRVGSVSRSVIFLCLFIFFLVFLATVFIVIFATRAALSSNSDSVEVLHFVGATADYIARQFQFHFFILGFRGSIFGAALIILLLVSLHYNFFSLDIFTIPTGLSPFSLIVSWYLYPCLFAIALSLAILTSLTSRFVVLRWVRN